MLFYLFLLFTAVPLVELALLIWIGKHIGRMQTVMLVLLTGFVGASLARFEGLRTLRLIQSEVGRGQLPGEALVGGAMILIAGALLITPGVLTDAVGLCVLIPPIRRLLAKRVIQHLKHRVDITYMNTADDRPRRHVDAKVTKVERDEVE